VVFTPPEVIIASSIGRKPLISTVKAFKSSQRVLRSSLVTELHFLSKGIPQRFKTGTTSFLGSSLVNELETSLL